MNNAKEQNENIDQAANELAKELEPFIQQIKRIHDDAVIIYTPLVEDLCRRKASMKEVECMLDWLIMFVGDDRMLQLYKRVCRTYWKIYPESIAFYIMEYKKEYEPESLIGTEYEYLLHEKDDGEE